MTAGRPATPPALHLIKGDPSKIGKGKLAALLDETLRPDVHIPELPSYLKYGGSGPELAMEAKAEWERITPHLAKLGLISELDRAAAANYCFYWALDVLASKRLIELGDAALIEETPSGYKQIGVWLQIKNRAAAALKTYLAEFGLSPAARSRVTPSDPQLSLPGVGEKPQEGGWAEFPAQTT
jgi:P27 family predicted phage terminase small subunit